MKRNTVIKLLVISFLLTALTSIFHSTQHDRKSFQYAGCSESNYKSQARAAISAIKTIKQSPCEARLLVLSAGFPLAFIYDDLTTKGVGKITLKDNIYFKPLFINLAFFIALTVVIYGVKQSKVLSRVLLFTLLSFLVTLASSFYPSNDMVTTSGEGYCGESSPCEVEVITGGFPFQYLYDNLGTSVVGVLSFQDNIRSKPFIYDMLFYFVVLLVFARVKSKKT